MKANNDHKGQPSSTRRNAQQIVYFGMLITLLFTLASWHTIGEEPYNVALAIVMVFGTTILGVAGYQNIQKREETKQIKAENEKEVTNDV